VPFPVLLPRCRSAAEHDDSNDPYTSTSGSFTGFVSASTMHHQHPAITQLLPDPEGGQDTGELEMTPPRDLITPCIGFTSASDLVTSSMGFTPASALAGQLAPVTHYGSSPSSVDAFEDYAKTVAQSNSFGCSVDNPNQRPSSAFTSLGRQKNLFRPSDTAMKKAQERAKRWAVEDDDLFLDLRGDAPEQIPDVTTSPHQPLQAIENTAPCAGPTASGSAIAQVVAQGTFQSAAHFSTPSTFGTRPFQTPSDLGTEGNAAMKPFKSPLLDPAASRTSANPQRTSPLCNTVAFTPTRGPKPADPFITEVNTPGSMFSTPIRAKGTPMRKIATKKFVTPFKPGMRPGEPGHKQFKARYDAERVNATAGPSTEGTSSMSDGSRKHTRKRFFDLSMSRQLRSWY
jgi:breast cancer 2 susceptibility protein